MRLPAALLLTTALAWPAAALSPEALWADWQETATRLGMTLDADAATEEGALVLSDVTTRFDVPVEGGTAAMSFVYDTVRMEPAPGDAVAVLLPGAQATRTTTTLPDGTVQTDEGTLETDIVTLVTDEGETRRYVQEGTSYVQTTRTAADDAAGVPAMIQTITMRDLSGVTTFTGDTVDSSTTSGPLSVEARAAEGDLFSVTYISESLTFEASGTLPDVAEGDVLATMNALDLAGRYDLGPATFKGVSTAEGAGFSASGTTGAASTAIAFGADGIRYDGTLDGMTLEVRPDPIPVPFSGRLEESSFALTIPTRASPQAQAYGLDVALRGVSLSDAVWGLFDPEGRLPRDPATIALGVSGTARVVADLFSEGAMAAALPPIEPEDLSLEELEVTAGGASLTGSGAVTFPVLAPVPQPVGRIDLRLTGGLALLDTLVAMGLVPADQATFARGMAGVVARPAGEDALESTIEFTEGGGIVANGLPLR